MGTMTPVTLTNVITVARREFLTRTTTRTFMISTLLLVVVAAAVALAPVAIAYLGRAGSGVAIYVGVSDLRGDPVAVVDGLLNPAGGQGLGSSFVVSRSADLDASRGQVADGSLSAVLDVERDGLGEPTFTLYTKAPNDSSTAVVARQAATSIAVADRLGRLGLSGADQAHLFAPPQITLRSPDLSEPPATTQAAAQEIADTTVIVALEMFLLLALMFYGTWIAQGVVEEKSSRMMEIILATASPFQLLAGKVLGVSAAAFVQFGAVLVTTGVALLTQDQIAALVLGDSPGVSLPSGLTPGILVAFAVFFVLGFLLYGVLFAAAGSLVSRHEDVSQIVTPMTLVVCAAYLVALYASLGAIDIHTPWVIVLSWVPFMSPYLMLSRLNAGTVGPMEVAVAVLLLAATIMVMTWVAARIYAAGVLLYGQKPSIRRMWSAIRLGRQ
jgi:ABC-2 type transport system permease protein